MRLRTLISLKTEPSLEKWARLFRYSKADRIVAAKLAAKKNVTLIDFGCGQDTLYYRYLKAVFPISKNLNYIGIDPLLGKNTPKDPQVRLIKRKFESSGIKEKADIITMFAVLEHVDDAGLLLKEAAKHLKPDGVIIITTPSPLARLPLEFFSYILGIIATREIDEHKRYPNRQFLLGLKKVSNLKIGHTYFELGLNNYCVLGNKQPGMPAYSFMDDLKLILTVVERAFRQV